MTVQVMWKRLNNILINGTVANCIIQIASQGAFTKCSSFQIIIT